jgi:hypothetical protein
MRFVGGAEQVRSSHEKKAGENVTTPSSANQEYGKRHKDTKLNAAI